MCPALQGLRTGDATIENQDSVRSVVCGGVFECFFSLLTPVVQVQGTYLAISPPCTEDA